VSVSTPGAPTPDDAAAGLDVYIVGGAVRDELLGLPAGDRDWVVVGATPEEMTRRGFIAVGGDFPVFLHPKTKEEYALARTERKTGRGYQGFTFHTGPEVTLAEDLTRRDLTVNAIAQAADGTLIDPLSGAADIALRVFRHVGVAFTEDPVRILRLARFAARFGDFSVAPETMDLARRMVDEGEVDALVPERVWKEVARGLMASTPSRMIDVLATCGALVRIMPPLRVSSDVLRNLDRAAERELPLAGRYALLCLDTPDREQLSQRLRVPSECADQARLLPVLQAGVRQQTGSEPTDIDAQLALIERCDALRKPGRFFELIHAADVVGDVPVADWQRRVKAVRDVDAGAIARQCAGAPERIKPALRAARLAALQTAAGHSR
jgi:tRNA nucleotidyltransferase (CCA-adding enzyme)